ncbi:MAG: hypothetical protein KC621_33420, partial [Myxococcales bacterium]|nr:hypothetical protein [Myxococcales bacterium]
MPSLHALTLSTVLLLAACQEGTAPVAASTEGLERAVLTGSVVQTDPWIDGFYARPAVVVDLDGDGWLDLVSGQDGAIINPLTGA